MSPTPVTVPVILRLITKIQMVRVYTKVIVTFVQYVPTLWNVATIKLP